MRALRPRSPRQTTAALIQEGRGGANILPALGVGPKPCEQVGRDTPTVLGRGADVVDWGDLIDENPPGVSERRAALQRLFRSNGTHHRRSDAAKRNPHRA